MKNKKITILVLSLLFSAVLIVYYAQPFFANPKDLAFNFKEVEGSIKEIENLHYVGTVEQETGLLIDISPQETKRIGSLLTDSMYTYRSPDIKRWQKEYRSFMRNKQNSTLNFFEEEESLFYLNDYNHDWNKEGEKKVTAEIERLDKKTKEVSKKSFTVEAPFDIQYISYQNIQKAGDFLAIQSSMHTSQSQINAIYIYNWDTGEIVDEMLAEEYQENQNESSYLTIETLDTENPAFLLNKTIYLNEFVPQEASGETEEVQKVLEEYQAYDPRTTKSVKVSLPEELTASEVPSVVGKGNIVFVKKKEDVFHISVFNVEKQEIVEEKNISVNKDTFSADDYFQLIQKDERLLVTRFYMEHADDQVGILLIDLNNLEKLFEGKMQLDQDSRKLLNNHAINFDSIDFN